MKKVYKITFIIILILLAVIPKVNAELSGNPWTDADEFLQTGAQYTDMHDESITIMSIFRRN